ncbi:hypothetical protein ACX9NE_07265 [Mycobacterium sp. ML4]
MNSLAIPTDRRQRTRSFARVLGPFIAVVPAIVAIRAADLGSLLSTFARDPMWPWAAGALLFFCGLFIIAFHQYWRNVAAVIISLFGWFLLLRGFALLAMPQLIVNAAAASTQPAGSALDFVRIGFGLLALCGLYLAYVGWVKSD